MAALLTQRAIVQILVAAGGHYVMVAKGNQPQLESDIAAEFRTPPPSAFRPERPRRRRTLATPARKSGV